jgi:hypothetical protein
MKRSTPWIHSAALDLPFVLGPPFIVLALVMLFPRWFGPAALFSEWHWLVLVLLIDVAHVYSTIYRAYLDPDTVRHYRFELVWLPLIAFVGMVLLHTLSMLWFWRCMAYLAIFHFVRQQYGFMRVYQRGEQLPKWKHRVDAITIYAATLVPLLHWHLDAPRAFHWFVERDMVGIELPAAASALLVAYAVWLMGYVASEVLMVVQGRALNIPKNLLLSGTVLSWYMGIVHYNGDITFTLFNVVCHGVPYMALVWAFGRRKRERPAGDRGWMARTFFSLKAVPLYLGLLFLLAYVEEGFWNRMVWKEHAGIFAPFTWLPVVDEHAVLSLLVPLLALPQVTHYIIDAFIWRMRKDRDGWQAVVFGRSV